MPVTEGQAQPKSQSALQSVPVFPPIAIRLLQVVSGEEVALGQVIELLRADAAFSVEILRRANSSIYGMSRQIHSLQHALVVLGLRRVRMLTLTAATGIYLRKALGIAELRRCWRHTLATALLAEELARAYGVHEDEAYTTGLMHDIGRLGILVSRPEEYAEFLQAAQQRLNEDPAFDMLQFERDKFEVDHCAAGSCLCEHWKLPQEFQAITGRHHDSFSGGEIDLLGIVQLACRLADGLGYDVLTPHKPPTLEEIRELLPAAARSQFHSDSVALLEFLETRINSLDIDRPDLPVQREPEPVESDAQEAPALWATPPQVQPPEVKAPSAQIKSDTARFTREILLAVFSSVLAAGVFFLLVRWFSE